MPRTLLWTQLSFALVLSLWLAGMDFFFPSAYRVKAGVHSLSSIAAAVLGTYLVHQLYPLLRGARLNLIKLRFWLMLALTANLAAAVSGNWIYMRYRAEDGPRDWILANAPGFHNLMMEFKEFVSLFPVLFATVCVFASFYYGELILKRRDLAVTLASLILLTWILIMTGLVTGLGLAKLRFV